MKKLRYVLRLPEPGLTLSVSDKPQKILAYVGDKTEGIMCHDFYLSNKNKENRDRNVKKISPSRAGVNSRAWGKSKKKFVAYELVAGDITYVSEWLYDNRPDLYNNMKNDRQNMEDR